MIDPASSGGANGNTVRFPGPELYKIVCKSSRGYLMLRFPELRPGGAPEE
jgi:hypothetical protein